MLVNYNVRARQARGALDPAADPQTYVGGGLVCVSVLLYVIHTSFFFDKSLKVCHLGQFLTGLDKVFIRSGFVAG